MSWEQFLHWAAYAEIEPFGETRADLRSAIIASVIANANRNSKKHPKPYTPDDFMPKFGGAGGGGGAGKGGARKRSSRTPMTDPEEWARHKRQASSYARVPE